MTQRKWLVLDEISGDLNAEILRGLLEAQGIQVMLSKEGAGRAMGLDVGPLGLVQVLVPAESLEEAQTILESFYSDLED